MKAAVLEQLNAPLKVLDLDMATHHDNKGGLVLLEYGQVLVRVLCAGICGAQLQEIAGRKGDPAHLPHVLGHEGCGIVEDTGPGVKHIKKGDKVVMHWRKGEGIEASPAIYRRSVKLYDATKCELIGWAGDAIPRIKSGPITTFSEFAIISENRITPVPQDFPDDLACLLGCSLSTALGVIENEARVKLGESVMIAGCGGVGLSLILAARLAGAHPIIAVDRVNEKRDLAADMGADYFSQDFESLDDVDVIIDTTGNTLAIGDASLWLKDSGRMILVGQPAAYQDIYFPSGRHLFDGSGKTIKATQGGRFSPRIDIPRYVNLWRSGALAGWENLITHRVTLDNINDGIELVKQGKAGRVLMDMK